MNTISLLIEFFGFTDDPKECGYILEDGRMLDFSGRHKGKHPSSGKWIEHFDLFGCNNNGFSLEDFFDSYPFCCEYPMAKIMDDHKLIKFCFDTRTVGSTVVPSNEQLRIIDSCFGDSWCILSCIDRDSFIKDDIELKYTTGKIVKNWFESAVEKKSTTVHTLTLKNLYNTSAKLYNEIY